MDNEQFFIDKLTGVLAFRTINEFTEYFNNVFFAKNPTDIYEPLDFTEHIVIFEIDFDSRKYNKNNVVNIYYSYIQHLQQNESGQIRINQRFSDSKDIWYSFKTIVGTNTKAGVQLYRLYNISNSDVGGIYNG